MYRSRCFVFAVNPTEINRQSERSNQFLASKLGDVKVILRHSPARKDVARAGAFSNQFIDGMKLLYELEPAYQGKGLPYKRVGKAIFRRQTSLLIPRQSFLHPISK